MRQPISDKSVSGRVISAGSGQGAAVGVRADRQTRSSQAMPKFARQLFCFNNAVTTVLTFQVLLGKKFRQVVLEAEIFQNCLPSGLVFVSTILPGRRCD